uniref:Copper transport protein n=1 Tax=Fagus sylvatica TaxID=28930 RepID=A0A2N9GEH0_FAGSY
MMHMTFYWGKNVTLLVDSWQTTSWTSYSLTLLARRVRFKLISSAKAGNPTSQIDAPLTGQGKTNSTEALQQQSHKDDCRKLQGGAGKASGSKLFALRLAGGALFGFNSGIGYLLMLAVMLFNGGVFVAIVLGLAVGTQKLLSLSIARLSLSILFFFSLSHSRTCGCYP